MLSASLTKTFLSLSRAALPGGVAGRGGAEEREQPGADALHHGQQLAAQGDAAQAAVGREPAATAHRPAHEARAVPARRRVQANAGA